MNTIFHVIASFALLLLVYLLLRYKALFDFQAKIQNSKFSRSPYYVGFFEEFLTRSSRLFGYEACLNKKSKILTKIDLKVWRDLFYHYKIHSIELKKPAGQSAIVNISLDSTGQGTETTLEEAVVKSLSMPIVCKITAK